MRGTGTRRSSTGESQPADSVYTTSTLHLKASIMAPILQGAWVSMDR